MHERNRMHWMHRDVKNAEVYVLVVQNIPKFGAQGDAFALSHGYGLTTAQGTVLHDAVQSLVKRAIPHETEGDWFPTMTHQAPAWAWRAKLDGATFTAFWFDPALTVRDAWAEKGAE